MALTKEQKQKQIEDLKTKLSQQKSVVLVDFSGVNSKDLFGLRKKLKEAGCLLKISKKTLLKIAFSQSGLSSPRPSAGVPIAESGLGIWDRVKMAVQGQLALILGIKDEVAPARIARQFQKENENFKILGGIFENQFIEKEKVMELSNLPSKEQLLGRLVGSLASPIAGFQNALIGNTRSLVSILSRIKN